MSLRIGVDIGGTKIAAAQIKDKRIIVRVKKPTPKTQQEFLHTLMECIHDVYAEGVEGVGIGFPGTVKNGVALCAGNISALHNVPLKTYVSERLGLPVQVANDADCFLLSQITNTTGTIAGMILGTGVGVSVARDGVILPGLHDSFSNLGELGHELYEGVEWDDSISGTGIEAQYHNITGKQLKAKALWNESDAHAVKELFFERLNVFLSKLVNKTHCDAIIIGGGLAHLPLLEGILCSVPVSLAKNVDDAGVIGASLLINNNFKG